MLWIVKLLITHWKPSSYSLWYTHWLKEGHKSTQIAWSRRDKLSMKDLGLPVNSTPKVRQARSNLHSNEFEIKFVPWNGKNICLFTTISFYQWVQFNRILENMAAIPEVSHAVKWLKQKNFTNLKCGMTQNFINLYAKIIANRFGHQQPLEMLYTLHKLLAIVPFQCIEIMLNRYQEKYSHS